ncbi:MAG: DUF4956 domain-containing protein [Bacillota bacterium]
MFESILSSGSLTIENVLLCTAVSLALGFIISYLYTRRCACSKHFAIALALLPAIVQAVILMVSGNLGAGVAVAGAFSLVRFRSIPGSAREIVAIFFAMTVGLACGMGYLAFAAVVTLIIGLVLLLLSSSRFGEHKETEKDLRITIPEELDYTGAFDDLIEAYTHGASLDRVKTVNLGSMYELRYTVSLKDESREKAFLDALRCRNGNLTIVLSRKATEEAL